MNRVLITGIDSFTGVHLSKYLEKAGYDIYGTSLIQSGGKKFKRSVPSDSVFKPLYAHPTEGVPSHYRNALPPYGVVSAEEHWAETEHAKHYGLEHLVPRREPVALGETR